MVQSADIIKVVIGYVLVSNGKWLWIPLDENLVMDDIIAMLKTKRRPNKK